jgi:LysR family glycine cleavage system transcriptional activator
MTLPDLDSLRCFEAAAVALNFRHAAATVALSPTAFGDRIRRLEDQLGRRLFVRTTRRVTLTVAGQRLLPAVQRVLEDARRCLSLSDDDGSPFDLTLGTRFELGLSWLTPALGPLRRARPERTLHLYFGESEDLMSRIRQGSVDCAVSSVRLASSGLRYELLHREDYAFVAAPRLLAERPLRRAADAPEHTLLDTQVDLPLFRYLLDSRPAGEDWRFRAIEHLGAIAAVRHRALDGVGVAVLPVYFIRRELASGKLRQPMPAARLEHDHFRLLWRLGHPREGEIRKLADELRRIPLT